MKNVSLDPLATNAAMAYGALDAVQAVVLGGSQGSGTADARSDIDLYVYADAPLPMVDREAIASRFGDRREVGNAFWESGDEWLDAGTGRHIDIVFRSRSWIEGELERVLVRHEASVGYTTAIWHSVLHSTPVFDRDGWYRQLQAFAGQPYPIPLKHAIVAKNHPILRTNISSYLVQIEKAIARNDAVSVQHRITALLSSYFDVIFAVNEITHPGEKRLLAYARERCPRQPAGMEDQMTALLGHAAIPPDPALVPAVNALLDGLDEMLRQNSLIA